MRIDWPSYFILMAKVAALRSGCNSRPTGAVIVKNKRIIATGFNGTLPGQPQCTDKGPSFCYRRSVGGPEDDKYNVCPGLHAEANAINQAARYGISIDGCEIYCTLSPCYVCLKNIASVGIGRVYFEYRYESSDSERDKIWGDFESVGLQGTEIQLFQNTLNYVFANLNKITSLRRNLGSN